MSALDGGEWSVLRPGRSTPEICTYVYICKVLCMVFGLFHTMHLSVSIIMFPL
jgi:hypothetical protein